MTYSIDQLKGSFPLASIFTIDDTEEIKLAVTSANMRDKIIDALSTKAESSVIFCAHDYPCDRTSTLFCLFPESVCGGVFLGGVTEWFAAANMNDLEDQWLASQAKVLFA